MCTTKCKKLCAATPVVAELEIDGVKIRLTGKEAAKTASILKLLTMARAALSSSTAQTAFTVLEDQVDESDGDSPLPAKSTSRREPSVFEYTLDRLMALPKYRGRGVPAKDVVAALPSHHLSALRVTSKALAYGYRVDDNDRILPQ